MKVVPIEATTLTMAQISPPRQPFVGGSTPDPVELGTLYHDHSVLSPPEPNPPFVFPMRSDPTDEPRQPQSMTAGGKAVPSMDSAVNRRPANRARPQRLSINALPAFDFHPSTSDKASPGLEALPPSPTKSIPITSRTGGHRRGGSEFIGRDGNAGGLGLMSTSPTKGEGSLPPPTTPTLGPPTSRRGHAHRRSGAISSHDLSTILRPSNDNIATRADSAPSTPSDPNKRYAFHSDTDKSASQSDLPSSGHRTTMSFDRRESAPTPGQPRVTRVGFSDTVEFIPRPLSTISSETSSSMSTIRANHSVTGSISSVVSGGTSSPPSAKRGRHSMDAFIGYHTPETRPKTADPIMSGLQLESGNDEDPRVSLHPSSGSASPSNSAEAASLFDSPGRRTFVGNDRRTSGVSPKNTPDIEHLEPSYPVSPPQTPDVQRTISRQALSQDSSPHIRSRPVSEPKIAKRQRKVKTWAGSILSRKGRHPNPKEKAISRRSATPPLRHYDNPTEFNLEDVNFDEDTTCVIHTPLNEPPQPTQIPSDYMSWKPRRPSPVLDPDALSPMLDLDAALGPFNTPTLGSEASSLPTAGFSTARWRMHSSGATGGFTGPGMHYHRRAESAPEMVPFNHNTFRLPRLNSNPTMADVFEEEEEDDNERPATTSETPSASSATKLHEDGGILSLGVQIVDSDLSDCGSSNQRGIKRKGSGLSEGDRRQFNSSVKQQKSAASLKSEIIHEESSPIDIVQADEEPRASVITKSSDESTLTPTVSNDPLANRPASAPIDFGLPRPGLYFTTPETPSSVVSSPDFNSNSFDVPRLGTATSSITDRITISSSRAGEMGQDLRVSVDDVPSLTSSASTMISAHPAPRYGINADARSSAEQPSSFSAAVPARTRQTAAKRSSLASLSRLVGSSYGERSKLSIEERAQPDYVEQTDKKKGNRLSRLMHFWKSKEKQSS